MGDNIEHLYRGTSLTTPRPAPVVPAAASEAAASMLLISILTDLAALKEAMAGQGAVYRAFNDFAREQLTINAEWVEALRHQVDVNLHQTDSNTAQNVCNAEVEKLFDMHNKLVEHVNNKLAGIIAEFDDRLHALDGKRSIVLSPPPAAEDHKAHTE